MFNDYFFFNKYDSSLISFIAKLNIKLTRIKYQVNEYYSVLFKYKVLGEIEKWFWRGKEI